MPALHLKLPILVVIGCLAWSSHSAHGATQKIVLIAGPITGHPKETHEYEKNVILLKHLLDTSPNLRGQVSVETHFKGWPANPATLDDADAIFFTSDGSDRRETDHPLFVGDRLKLLERQMQRGCGLVMFHWSTFSPMRVHDQITEWVGGHFDYETGPPPRKWFSAIQTWQALSKLGTPDHPIARGVKPFNTQEEYYYRMRFLENDPRLKPIVGTRPPNEANDFPVGWAVERSDGGRGFGFTGGHFYQNWWNADFRKLILNAIIWAAKLEVPAEGVQAELFERFKVLILTGHNHPAHEWRSVTAALILALEQDPRAIVHVTENIEDLATDKVRGYDLLVMNYSNWDKPGLSDAGKANFIRYLENGGGLAVIHFANGAFTDTLPNKECDWPEYRTRIVRRIWDHRPGRSGHDAYGPFRVEIAGVKHPIIDGLQSFETVDELYYRQWGELPIEPLAYATSKDTKQREPMAWACDYGKGRVFQTVLGHADESVRKAAALIRRGSVWAAGRSQISFDPPTALTDGALFRDGSQWTIEQSRKRAQAQNSLTPAATAAFATQQLNTNDRAKAADAKGSKTLPPNVGLDQGGKYGHWGNEGENDWEDNRWEKTESGPFFASSLKTPAGVARKSIAIRVGESNEGAVCFDTGQLSLKTGWTGGFLRKSPKRYGVIEMPAIDGQIAFASSDGPGWGDAPTRYRGLYVRGARVVLAYDIDGTGVLDTPWLQAKGDIKIFTRTIELGSANTEQHLTLLGSKGSRVMTTAIPTGTQALVERSNMVAVVQVIGPRTKLVKLDEDRIAVAFAPHREPRRVKILTWTGDKAKLPDFYALAEQLGAPEDLSNLIKPGPARWTAAIITRGSVGRGPGPFVIDTMAMPYDNPYKALLFASGHDFFSNGDAALCTLHGDVWRVSGIDERLEKLTWKRMATGLYQALGLKIVNDKVLVLGRDQITRLHDNNGDGEADFYDNFHNAIKTSPGGHDYVACLERDPPGNFYYADPIGVHRVSADGANTETLATGWRNPNGLAVSPDGVITVSPQEGEWTPASHISELKAGGYYGYGGPKVTAARPLGYDAPLCWIPRYLDNSSGGQVWVPANHWGSLAGHLLHLSYGRCGMMLILRDVIDGQAQGAVVPLKGRFLSGVMRGSFRPQDGHLYVTGLRGWVTSALRDGCFQRVRYTGEKPLIPTGWRAYSNGLRIAFSDPLDRAEARNLENYGVEQWNYHYAAEYGSKEFSVHQPNVEGHDAVEVRRANVIDDRTVFLEIPGLKPVMQLQVRYNLTDKEGEPIRGKLIATINRLGPVFDLLAQ
ncbi:MAG: ThuA domain-containing protein [Verrucomicrobia bacterium]|nr:ThuA domain-containing protein [Verrucomicrobiota bacterium]